MNVPALLLIKVINLYIWIVIGSVLLSWLNLPPENPIRRFVNSAVDPVLAPLRGKLTLGGLDWSPMVLIIGLQVLQRVVASAFL